LGIRRNDPAGSYIRPVPGTSGKPGNGHADSDAVSMKHLIISHINAYMVDYSVMVCIRENQITGLQAVLGNGSANLRLLSGRPGEMDSVQPEFREIVFPWIWNSIIQRFHYPVFSR
jgi:hypothetical protein